MNKKIFEAAKNMLCLPLDGLKTLEEIETRIKELAEFVGVFKIGKETFTRFGPVVIDLVHKYDAKVFLDLKFHDIPSTVKGAAKAATEHKVWMFNVHSSGGIDMMKAAKEGVLEAMQDNSQYSEEDMPIVIAVTLLTSLKKDDLLIKNPMLSMGDMIQELADAAKFAGLNGIVCSADDLNSEDIEEGFNSFFPKDFKFITPGIKLTNGNVGADQKRVVTPYQAIKNGSSLLVAGRTITGYDTSEERKSAAKAVLEDMVKALLEK